MLSSPVDAASIAASIRRLLSESSDPSHHTYDDSRLVSMAKSMGQAAGLSQERLNNLVLAARVFDVGAAWTPGQTLLKKSGLIDAEWDEIVQHVSIGQQVAEATPGMAHLSEIILHHHEWWNGTGYPGLLSGTDIPLESRILAVIDAYDSMTSGRPYRKAMSHEKAMAELKRCAGTQFEPEMVALFCLVQGGRGNG